jgi:hypothetical protein
LIEEGAELQGAVVPLAGAGHGSRLHGEGGEQVGGVVAGMVVAAMLHLAGPHRQDRRNARECLDL